MRVLFFMLCILSVMDVYSQPVKIIFDTDMESDVDDVAALAMLHGLANLGDCEILATISSSLNPWAAPTIDVVNTYFNRPDIPIASVKTKGVYRNSKYAKVISETYPQDIGLGESVQNATKLYRKILSRQSEKSVVIVTVGYLTNLSKLLNSGPDEYSPLDGKELIREKVKHYVCMGGRFPGEQNPGKFGNFKPDPEATVHVSNEWPTQIIFTTGGDFSNAIPSGKILFSDVVEKGNPVSEAYQIFLQSWNRTWHHSADLIAVYVAVKGHEPYFELRKHGYFHIFEDGTHVWRASPDRAHHHIVAEFADGVSGEQVADDFDALLVKPTVDDE